MTAPRKCIVGEVAITNLPFEALMDEDGDYFVPIEVIEGMKSEKADELAAFAWWNEDAPGVFTPNPY